MNSTYYLQIESFCRTVFVRVVSVLMICGLGCHSVLAQSWNADNMFAIKSHDFGNVPLLSDTQHSFVFHNTSKQDVRIASISSSCSCAEAWAPVKIIRSGEKGEIIAKVNTTGQHTKKKSSTITVTFDQPSTAHVQLEVAVYIRPDIVLNPGSVDFGAIREGQKITKTVQLQYAGNPNWSLVRIDRANKNPYIHAIATLVKNPGNSREITYNIQVSLSEKAPAGYVREILRFITNDQNSVAIELPVSGFVMDALVARPSPFQFGSIAPGETVTKYLVLRASQPFRVKSVRCPEDRRFIFSTADQTSSVHIVAVTLTSKQENSENIRRTIDIETTLESQGKLQIPIYAHFLSAEEVNFSEHFASQWKPRVYESRDRDLTGNIENERKLSVSAEKKTRSLSTRTEKWGEVPVDDKTFERITSGETQSEVPDEEESVGPSLDEEIPLNFDPNDATENGMNSQSSQPGTNSSVFVDEYPPAIIFDEKIEAFGTQDWVPLTKNREITDTDSLLETRGSVNLGTIDESDWRPSIASNMRRSRSLDHPVPQPQSLYAIPKPSGKVRFGTPQTVPVAKEEKPNSSVDENGENTKDNVSTAVPKKIVAKPLPVKIITESSPKNLSH